MNYTFMGRTGVRVSQLGFGTMSFGTSADPVESRKLFTRCREAGINFFDCANVYGQGRAEEILGTLVEGCRDEVVITTKAYFPTSQDVNARGASRFHLVRAVEASLQRLGTDRIDVLFLHRFDDMTALDETLRAVDDLVRQGKILYPAASNFAAWQTMKALNVAATLGASPIVAIQPMYNLAKRTAEIEILPMALSEQLAVFPYGPLGGGLLTGKYGRHRQPDQGRLVENAMYRTRYGERANYALADAFTALAQDIGVHPVSLAIAWVSSHPAVTAPLLGARNVEQLEPALASLDIQMDDGLAERIQGLSPTPPPATDRNEETSRHNYGSR